MTWYDDLEPPDEQPWFEGTPGETAGHVAFDGVVHPPATPGGPSKTVLAIIGGVVTLALIIIGVSAVLVLSSRDEDATSNRAGSRQDDRKGLERDRAAASTTSTPDDDDRVVLSGPDDSKDGPQGGPSPSDDPTTRSTPPDPTGSGVLSLEAYAEKMCDEVILPQKEAIVRASGSDDWIELKFIDPDNVSASEARTLTRFLTLVFDHTDELMEGVGGFNDRFVVAGGQGNELQQDLAEFVELSRQGVGVIRWMIDAGDRQELAELALEVTEDVGNSGTNFRDSSPGTFDQSPMRSQLNEALIDVDHDCSLT